MCLLDQEEAVLDVEESLVCMLPLEEILERFKVLSVID